MSKTPECGRSWETHMIALSPPTNHVCGEDKGHGGSHRCKMCGATS